MNEQMFEEVERTAGKAFAALRPWAEKLRAQYVKVGNIVDGALWAAYRNGGAIYGDTPEGRERWMREVAEIKRLRMLADEIEDRHRTRSDFLKAKRRREREQGQKG